ncbi:hypothetical protein SAMN05880574_104139 [Chryseobacterium sp. RU37D]|nr:hypothetical protein SAMN05880574_104139 [Chryseobacterium sp. RU37D]
MNPMNKIMFPQPLFNSGKVVFDIVSIKIS